MLVLYLFQFVYKFNRVPWLRIEMWVCAVEAALYLVAACLAADVGTGAYIAASVSCWNELPFAVDEIECFFSQFFGFLAMLAYGYDAFLKYRATTGIIIASQKTTTVTTVTVA